ncbi:peptidoglycan D,D-transpeptidase FtsI family protein [Streptomyces hygroscopicus]|uniref:peptidoglycan D,D-transpeptidase FtsI family protein n=1 Tax=Streptomyces hygroscopicus TaxID=1912 RepID=UPI00082A17A3|nr:penicillin-binding protein 2 [Streptomyces hygroscopicus]GLV75296.1 penicillin-binding protein [Streptomyces hygroscopicus subsp. hygroscopicus]
MNKPLRRASVFSLLLVMTLLVWITYVELARGASLRDNAHNSRVAISEYAGPLGDILAGGERVTGSAATQGNLKYKRTYPDGKLWAPVTGYASQSYGSTQLEALERQVLDGSDSRLKNPLQALTRERSKPGDVITTIDPAVQKAAYRGLGNKTGAAVAIDPTTGAVLALVSTPSYDPGTFAGSSSADQKAWNALQKDRKQPMLNRALRQTYPPGSTFKVVVAAAALENGLYSSVDEPTKSPDPYRLPGTVTDMHNENSSAPCENATIRTALQYSCNTVFAKMAVDLGQSKVAAQAKKLGFGDSGLDIPVRAAKSVYPSGMNDSQTALSGMGQFDVTATPLQMAMVSSAVANDGKLMTPYEVDRTTDGSASALDRASARTYSRAMSQHTASELRSAMRTVVDQGTGANAKIPGVAVGGKTGTAQHGENNSANPYAWFMSYADAGGGHKVAVAVVVEDSDAARADISGGGLAGPIAKAMMKAALP